MIQTFTVGNEAGELMATPRTRRKAICRARKAVRRGSRCAVVTATQAVHGPRRHPQIKTLVIRRYERAEQ